MLLSLRELIVWTGLSTFEVSLHCFALCIFTILTTLRVEGLLDASWHVIFIPLYVALATMIYYDIILYLRMATFMWKNPEHHGRRYICYMIAASTVVAGMLVFAEYSVADFLDNSNRPSSSLILSLTLLLGYFFFRMLLTFRALRRE